MKKPAVISTLLLSLLFCLFSAPSGAQKSVATYQADSTSEYLPDNVVGLNLFGLWGKLRLSYEYVVDDNFSAGMQGTLYYIAYEGLKLEPFVRVYFGGENPRGFYAQLNAAAGLHAVSSESLAEPYSISSFKDSRKAFAAGGGGGMGYQFMAGHRRHTTLDVYWGLQIYKPLYYYSRTFNGSTSDGYLDTLEWYASPLSPAFPLLVRFSLGFAF